MFWGSNGIWTHDLRDTGAMFYQLSFETSLEACQKRVPRPTGLSLQLLKLLHNCEDHFSLYYNIYPQFIIKYVIYIIYTSFNLLTILTSYRCDSTKPDSFIKGQQERHQVDFFAFWFRQYQGDFEVHKRLTEVNYFLTLGCDGDCTYRDIHSGFLRFQKQVYQV